MRIVATNDFTTDVAKIKCPTLLLMGESGHLGYGEDGNRNLANEFLALAPHASLKLIAEGGGTYCMIEEPQTTAQAIIDFIDALER